MFIAKLNLDVQVELQDLSRIWYGVLGNVLINSCEFSLYDNE
jgi:hypothetical protein